MNGDRMSEYDSILPTAQLVMEANGKVFYPDLDDNHSAREFFDRLKPKVLEVRLEDRDGIEKSGRLPWSLPSEGIRSDANPGDIVLYGDDEIAICFGEGVRDVVRIARLRYVSAEELAGILGDGGVDVMFWLEWSE